MKYEAETIDFSRLYCRGKEDIGTEGTLTDGSGLEDYVAHTDCKWLITAPEGKVIRFQFGDFHTEARTDLLFFFNGSSTRQDELIAVFSGSDTPPEFTTWRNRVLVWFVTDGQNQRQGWQVTYRFQDP